MPSYHHITDDTGMIFIIDPLMILGVQQIDDDHKKLFKIIDSLNNQNLSTESKDLLFDSLTDYAIKHFLMEAKLFKDTNYDDSIHHLNEHQKVLKTLKKLRLNNAKMPAILKFLTAWLNNHILVEDLKFVKFYKSLTV